MLKSFGVYKRSKLDGPYKVYSESRQLLSDGNYKDGKLDGEHKRYYATGIIRTIIYYEDGKKIDQRNFDARGKLELD